ncbi:MAG: DUF1415 domain-containing protein [Gammaproteobacteria bacterium]|nr:DUF1415 domain-containing protein [Gammaproteobacteria bacterium]
MNESSISNEQARSDQSMIEQGVIKQTRCWVKTVIVGNNFCPFARRELERGSIRYSVKTGRDMESALQAVVDECIQLDNNDAIETMLLIFPEGFQDFEDYLQLVELAEGLLADQGYESVYQVASFHPDYCFAGAEQNDAANYTNRSPYPMLHLIREASLEQALINYPEPEKIPEQNVERARELGLEEMQRRLKACCSIDKQ